MNSIKDTFKRLWAIETLIRIAPKHQPKTEPKCQVAHMILKCFCLNPSLPLDGITLPSLLLSLKIKNSPR